MITFRRLGHFGRFGNQLFQYAGTRLYAELNGFDWAFPPWIGDRLFNLPHKPLRVHHNLLPTVQLQDVKCTSWPERLLHPLGLWRRGSIWALWAHPKDSINLYGYLQDEISLNTLHKHRDRVRSWFRFRPEIDAAFRKATQPHRPWVATHVRRGDLIKRNLTIPIERYHRILPDMLGERALFVASDDPNIAQEFSRYRLLVLRSPDIGLPPFVFDFWMMQEAQALCAGNSTFAWWAAFLGSHEKVETLL
jgi:hypothetical protein